MSGCRLLYVAVALLYRAGYPQGCQLQANLKHPKAHSTATTVIGWSSCQHVCVMPWGISQQAGLLGRPCCATCTCRSLAAIAAAAAAQQYRQVVLLRAMQSVHAHVVPPMLWPSPLQCFPACQLHTRLQKLHAGGHMALPCSVSKGPGNCLPVLRQQLAASKHPQDLL